ncbi:MAG: ABC transporter substrate-binding protein [Chloroflexi bacterium]|nr:ABC transporter substrate-binding protein [Chloroflexota bacterium]
MKKPIVVIAVIVVIALVGFGVWYFANSAPTYSGPPETITLGMPLSITHALIYVAEDRGLFTGNGLNVTAQYYDASQNAVDAMKNGQYDIALTSEYNIVIEAFKKENIGVLGVIDKNQATYVIARKDRGIEKISDLRGKKVGLTRGAVGEFHLGRFLNLEGMRLQDVILINLVPDQRVNALADGRVDAILVTKIYLDQAEKRLGNNRLVWTSRKDQITYIVMASTNDWATRHPEAIRRLLKALAQAAEYITKNPASAQAIVQKRLNYDDATMAALWGENQFALSLDQSLVIAMKDEAQWMIVNNLTAEKTIPDFMRYIYLDGLQAVKPESVSIIR